MIDFNFELEKILKQKINKKSFLKSLKRDGVVLYGAGSMGKMAIDLMKKFNISPEYIIDKKAQGELDGIKIISPEQIKNEDCKKYTVIVCIVTIPFNPLYQYLKDLGFEDVRHFYDYSEIVFPSLMSNGWMKSDLTPKDIESIKNVLKSLEHDETSLAHYLQFLWWRIARKEFIYPSYPVLTGRKFFKTPSMPKLTKNEIFIDGGAHLGQSIQDFLLATEGEFKHIYAFEPDEENLKILKNNINDEKVTFLNQALYDIQEEKKFLHGLDYASKIVEDGNKIVKAVPLDLIENLNPTIIKLHIEGDELKALEGAKKTIEKQRPILMVMADHNEDGLFKIPEFIIGLKDYKLYFNLHDYCGNSAVFYGYPKERELDK